VQRHQTLRAAIDWSYDLLSHAEQRLLARLSVFSGGFSRQSAEEVCAGDAIETSRVFALLTGLVARSLVLADRHDSDTRYRLLETIREYGEERLTQYGETKTVRQRHAAHYCAYSRSLCELFAGPGQPEAMQRLRAEHQNLIAAMAYALDESDTDLALRLLTAPQGLAYQLSAYKLSIDALELEGAAEHRLYPRALATAAVYVGVTGDFHRAERLYTAALDAIGIDERDPVVEYLAVEVRGLIALYRGDYLASADLSEEMADVAQSAGLAYEQVYGVVTASSWVGDPERALRLATEALTLARQVDAPVLLGACLMGMAVALADTQPTEARRLLREGLEISAAIPGLAAPDLLPIVYMAARLEDWETVLDVAPDAIRGFRWLDERPNQAGMLNLVSRALASTDAETAALLQGATRKLMPAPSAPPADTNLSPQAEPLVAPSGGRRTVTELRRQTTSILRDTLGEARLRDLRSEGEAMDDDHIVALTLDAIARARVETPQ
jgi:hypothetical protein